MYERIVAGTDMSATARVATDRAHALASALKSELILVNAGKGGDDFEELAKQYGARAIAEDGNPPDVLVSQCEQLEADLLVVGSVGMSGARRFLLGSVPNKVSHHATRDLLIVKTDPPPPNVGEYKRILVGTDGSPTATRAVEMSAQLAKALGISPVVVCAYEPLTPQELAQLKTAGDPLTQWKTWGKSQEIPEEFRWRIAAAAQAEDVLDRAQEHTQKFDVQAEVRAVEGQPAEALLSVAEKEGFDVVAVGSVGMSGAKRFMLGNVPNRISHHSPTDVLIFKTA
ncbi:MAG TPA: universal stress protein [Actinomycetota bacterium]|nr:universal stress protein [Actinomycetota bacterium]